MSQEKKTNPFVAGFFTLVGVLAFGEYVLGAAPYICVPIAVLMAISAFICNL
jgi:hypothetical protein